MRADSMDPAAHQLARDYYDEVAPDYDRRMRREGDLIDRREKELLKRVLGDLSGRRVLDFGCGTGRISLFHRRQGAAEVVGVDVSPRMIDMARAKLASTDAAAGVEFRVFEPAAVVAPSGEAAEPFDVVTSLEVLEYFAEPAEFFATLSRHVAPGGHVVFDFLNRHHLPCRLKSHLSRQWRESGLRLHSLGDVHRMCAAADLDVVTTSGVFMSLLPLSIHSKLPLLGTRWSSVERVLDRSTLLRRVLSYRVLVAARKRA